MSHVHAAAAVRAGSVPQINQVYKYYIYEITVACDSSIHKSAGSTESDLIFSIYSLVSRKMTIQPDPRVSSIYLTAPPPSKNSKAFRNACPARLKRYPSVPQLKGVVVCIDPDLGYVRVLIL